MPEFWLCRNAQLGVTIVADARRLTDVELGYNNRDLVTSCKPLSRNFRGNGVAIVVEHNFGIHNVLLRCRHQHDIAGKTAVRPPVGSPGRHGIVTQTIVNANN